MCGFEGFRVWGVSSSAALGFGGFRILLFSRFGSECFRSLGSACSITGRPLSDISTDASVRPGWRAQDLDSERRSREGKGGGNELQKSACSARNSNTRTSIVNSAVVFAYDSCVLLVSGSSVKAPKIGIRALMPCTSEVTPRRCWRSSGKFLPDEVAQGLALPQP